MTNIEMNVCLKEYAEYKRIKEEAEIASRDCFRA